MNFQLRPREEERSSDFDDDQFSHGLDDVEAGSHLELSRQPFGSLFRQSHSSDAEFGQEYNSSSFSKMLVPEEEDASSGPAIECHHCQRRFPSKSDLYRHLLSSEEEQFACHLCGCDFKFLSGLRRHLRAVHSARRRHRCPDCQLTFHSKDKLKSHTCLSERKKEHVCSRCGQFYSCRSSLDFHVRMRCFEGPFDSPRCHKDFPTSARLPQHSNTRPHTCDHCGKRFALKSNLNSHLFLHSNKEYSTCKYCRRNFSSKQNMLRHAQLHTTRRPFACPHCDKSFPTRSSLSSHASIHAGRRFICSHCGKAFNVKSNLNRHMFTHLNAR